MSEVELVNRGASGNVMEWGSETDILNVLIDGERYSSQWGRLGGWWVVLLLSSEKSDLAE